MFLGQETSLAPSSVEDGAGMTLRGRGREREKEREKPIM
jgi:hypothetical protein